ncbi:nuclear GTPase SLIP-GC-like isoform 2-T2 [Odontesthes bonariensis]|uniref:nuclear GTPase SLIP-GC-like isoform X2 n=1 Tax=Odontesthes bonariensis TaxID=219752 RepID=UPI003F58C362
MMDDFVREKLIQWGLSEWMETFKEQEIDKESLYCLNDRDIDNLIPKVGPRARFKKKLEELKQEEQNANQDTQGSSFQLQDKTNDMTEVGPSPGKRKSDHQGETSEWQTPTKWPRDSKSRSIEEAVILSKVKVAMENVKAKIQDNTELNDFLKTKIIDLETDKRELVGVFGRTGTGKSSLINTVIGVKNLLPSGSVSACTSVMIKVEANMSNTKYEAEIEFITKEEWRDELWSMFQFLGDKAYQEKEKDDDDDDDDDEYHDICKKLSALYEEEWKQKSCENLMDNKYFREIQEFLQSKKKSLTCESAQELSAKLVKYTRTDTKQGQGREVRKWYWPLVKRVTVRVPQNDLLQHVTIVDLPGNGDRNKSRDKMWKGIVGDCSTVWIVTEINRAAADKESWEILKSAASLLGNGGECQRIHFICTKSDLFEDFDDHSKADFQALVRERNTEAKDEVNKEFNKLNEIKKHFGDDCFEVFTVSAKEFLKRKLLERGDTEIPKLQEFLQNLNDRHSKTLNYVSGARAILSQIQAARLRETVGNETEVCEELERNMTYHLFPVKKAMEDAFQTFDRCLSEGVEKSKSSCEGNLNSFLYLRKTGRGFHRTLKCVVKNNGSHKPKKGKEINFNRKLTSSLTDSIDEEFRKTFPNEGKCEAFDGVISTFSLGTKELIQKYKDVELQLIFLKTEEDKMKTKLSRLICDRKKTIYSSLLKTIEEIMQECYENATEFKGKDSLQNMRDTIVRHVYESKNSMFDRAKTVMLNELKELTDEIVETLEKTMTKSIELSLKTDYKSIPDVSAELTMVQKLYDELRSISDEEMS